MSRKSAKFKSPVPGLAIAFAMTAGCQAPTDLSTLMTGMSASPQSVKKTALPSPRPAVADKESPPKTGSQPREAKPAAPGPGFLGRTVVSLGDTLEPGLWASTPLVARETAGRVQHPSGKSVSVTLYPGTAEQGAGTQLSLGAMQALGMQVTDLSEVLVFKR